MSETILEVIVAIVGIALAVTYIGTIWILLKEISEPKRNDEIERRKIEDKFHRVDLLVEALRDESYEYLREARKCMVEGDEKGFGEMLEKLTACYKQIDELREEQLRIFKGEVEE